MPEAPSRSRFTLGDLMILVASLAALLGVIPGWAGGIRIGGLSGGLQGTVTSAAVFVGLGGLGACAARLRGRPRFEGFCWAFICGPCGLVLIALMPSPPED